MSKFATTYANICNVKLPKWQPKWNSLFIPVPEKYITLQSGSGAGSARNYSFYNEVIQFLLPKLRENNIHVVQIGDKSERSVAGCIDFRGQTNLRQATFVVDNALLHLGNDSFFTHYAGSSRVPVVALYGPTQSKVTGPYYCDNEKTILIDSDRGGNKASHEYVGEENPRTVDMIAPEVVAQSVLKLLNIDFEIPFKTLHIGPAFCNDEIIDFIPDFPLPANVLSDKHIGIRCDLSYKIEAVAQALALYPCNLVTDKPIPPNILEKFKKNIKFIIVRLDNLNYNKNWLRALKHSGIKYQLISRLRDDDLANLKLDLFDFNPVHKDKSHERSLDNELYSCDSYFMTKRKYLSNGRFYPSLAHWRANAPFNHGPVKIGNFYNDLEFLEGMDHYHIYNQIKKDG